MENPIRAVTRTHKAKNPISFEITNIIIECVAQKHSLRFLYLDLPEIRQNL